MNGFFFRIVLIYISVETISQRERIIIFAIRSRKKYKYTQFNDPTINVELADTTVLYLSKSITIYHEIIEKLNLY